MTSSIPNSQASLALTVFIQQNGIFPSRDPGTFIAQLGIFAGNFGPNGALLAAGQTLSIAQNTAFFSLLGTTYGGNGITTFALPNLSDTALIGTGQGPGLDQQALGAQLGISDVTLTSAQLPQAFGGTNQPFDNYQPSLPLSYIVNISGTFPTDTSGGNNFLGEVVPFAGNFAPLGWAFANGQLLPISGNDALFNVIGTIYGGDGNLNFALPDLRGRDIIGVGPGDPIGANVGQPSVTLTNAQVPISPGGSAQPFVNQQPSLAMTYLIATQGIFPTSDGNGSIDPNEPFLGEIVAFAGNFAPRGWAIASGQLLPINQNQALFALLGTNFGGDGRTNFALPNLNDRTVVGTTTDFPIGTTFGSDFVTIDLSQVPPPTLIGQMVLSAATEGVALPANTTVATFTDSNTIESSSAFLTTIDWGDGTTTAGTLTGGSGSFAVSGGHTYADEGSDQALVTISHIPDGTQTTPTGTITVLEADSLTPHPMAIDAIQGQIFSGTVATFTDTNTNNLPSDFTAIINWGDGTTTTGAVSQPVAGTFQVSGSHAYTGVGTDNVTVTLTDDAPGTATATAISTASVTQPLSGQVVLTSIMEGVATTGTVATFSDTNVSDTAGGFTAAVDWGDGTTEAGTITGANGSFAVAVPASTHFYVDEGSDQALVTITRTSDGDQIAPTGTVTVTEGDVLTPHPMAIDAIQGGIFSGTVATFTDTNTNNVPSDFTAIINWGDGTTTAGAVSQPVAGTFQVSGSHAYTGVGTDNVSVTLTDDAPGTATATAISTASVTQPLSGQVVLTSISEGAHTSGQVATFTDTNVSDTAGGFTAAIDWGDGTTEAGTITGANGSFAVAVPGSTHFYVDEGSDQAVVTITRTSDGDQIAPTGIVTVEEDDFLSGQLSTINAHPGVIFSGTVATFSNLGPPTSLASDFTATINWGDGTTTPGTVTGGGFFFSVSGSHTYAAVGTDNVFVTLADDPPGKSVGFAAGTANVTQPLSGQVVLTSIMEGVATTGTVATFSDTNVSDTAGGFTAAVDWGDGTTEAGTITGANGSFAVAVPSSTHFYVDESSDQAVVTITRTSDGDQIAPTSTVTVTEGDFLTPHLMAIDAIQGQIFSGTVATFTDSNTNNVPSDFTALINWGDGTTTTGTVSQPVAGTFQVSGSHTYTAPGTDNVTVTLTDDAPGTAAATAGSTASVTTPSTIIVSSGVTSAGLTISRGVVLEVLSGGTASSTTLSSGGVEFVAAGGSAGGTTVSNGGFENVAGTARSTTLISGGVEFVAVGGSVSGTTVSNGGFQNVAGAASGTTLSSGGVEFVAAGGSVSGTIVSNGGFQNVAGAASGTTLSSGGIEFVAGGGSASGTTLGSGGIEFVAAGGSASGTTVVNGGFQNVTGAASGTTVSSGGVEYVAVGGSVSSTTVSSGGFQNVAGAASGTTLNSGGVEFVAAGGSVSSTTVSSGGFENVAGVARGTTLMSGGVEFVAAGGSVSSTTVSSGGFQNVAGAANGTTLSSGGMEFVAVGGSASGTQVNGGGFAAIAGAASAFVISSGGGVVIASGGTDSGTHINSGGFELVSSGGLASGAIISGGALEVQSGGSTGAGAVTFAVSGGGILLLDDSVHYGGLVAGFGKPDFLDLRDIAFNSATTTLSWNQLTSGGTASGTLTVSDTVHSASITLLGQYAAAGQFTSASDGQGGTLVGDPPVVAQTDPQPIGLVNPHQA